MKKTMLLIVSLFIYTLALAQDEKKIGGLLAFGTEIESAGIGVNAEFPIASVSKLSIAPSFIFYFPKTNSFVKTTLWELNINANYYFTSSDKVDVYGIGGLNYTTAKVKTDFSSIGYGENSASDSSVGLNLGAGANFKLDKSFVPFAELKYTLGDFDQLVLAGGLKFNF